MTVNNYYSSVNTKALSADVSSDGDITQTAITELSVELQAGEQATLHGFIVYEASQSGINFQINSDTETAYNYVRFAGADDAQSFTLSNALGLPGPAFYQGGEGLKAIEFTATVKAGNSPAIITPSFSQWQVGPKKTIVKAGSFVSIRKP